MKNNALNFVFNLNKNEIINKLNEFIEINDYLKNELNNLGFIKYKHYYLNKNKKIKIFYDYEFNSFVIIKNNNSLFTNLNYKKFKQFLNELKNHL